MLALKGITGQKQSRINVVINVSNCVITSFLMSINIRYFNETYTQQTTNKLAVLLLFLLQ
jgi:hypothetical protein